MRGPVVWAAVGIALAGCVGPPAPDSTTLPVDLYASALESDDRHVFRLGVHQEDRLLHAGEYDLAPGSMRHVAALGKVHGPADVVLETEGTSHEWRVSPAVCKGREGLIATISFAGRTVDLLVSCSETLTPHA